MTNGTEHYVRIIRIQCMTSKCLTPKCSTFFLFCFCFIIVQKWNLLSKCSQSVPLFQCFLLKKVGHCSSSATVTFCDFLSKKTLQNPEISWDCYTFLTLFCNSPGVATVTCTYVRSNSLRGISKTLTFGRSPMFTKNTYVP